MNTAKAGLFRRQVWFWSVIALAAPFIPAGPLALVVGALLLARTAIRVSDWLSPDDPLARWPAAWLVVCTEIPILAELLSLGNLLNSPPAWLLAQIAVDAAVHGLRGGNCPPLSGRQACAFRTWRRAVVRANGLIKTFLLLFAVLFSGNLMVAAMSGIMVHDAVTTYVPMCIDFVQRGTLALPAHDHNWPFPSLFTAWHTLYLYTIAIGDTLAAVNILGWLSSAFGLLAAVCVCRQTGLSRVMSCVASAVAYSAPLAVCQAANANFDQQAGFCLTLTVYAGMRALRDPRRSNVALLSLAQVLLAATKLTSAFIAPVVLVLDLLVLIRCRRTGRTPLRPWLIGFACAAAALLLGPHFARNSLTYGSPVPQTPHLSARPDSWGEAAAALGLRQLQLMTPYELGWIDQVRRAAEAGAPGARRFSKETSERLAAFGVHVSPGFVRSALNHLFEPYNSDRGYLGGLPLLLAVFLLCSLVGARPTNRAALRWLGAFVGTWVAFQLGYALLFRYTPHNGRYMLLAWFLAAPVLGLLIRRFPRPLRLPALLVTMLVASIEHTDWFLHRKHAPLNLIMNEPRSEHFRLAQMPSSNISDVRRRLDERGVERLYYDTPRSFRLLYYDAARRRRFVYRSPPPFADDCAILTDLPTPTYDDGKLRSLGRHYEIIFIGGENDGAEDRAKAVLLPYVVRVRPATDLVSVQSGLRDRATLAGTWASRRFEGVHRGPDWRDCYWLGPGPGGRLEFEIEASAPRAVMLCMWIGAVGPRNCDLELTRDAMPVAGIAGPSTGKAVFRTSLHAGTNRFALLANADEDSGNERLIFISGIELADEALMPRQLDLYHYYPVRLEADAWFAPLASRASLTTRIDDVLKDSLHLIGVQIGRDIGDVEFSGQTGTVWLGPRGEGEFKAVLRSRAPARTLLSLSVEKPGIALPDDGRCPVTVLVDDRSIGSFIADRPGEYRIPLPISTGTNVVRVRAEADADTDRYGDDRRPTMLLLRSAEIRPWRGGNGPRTDRPVGFVPPDSRFAAANSPDRGLRLLGVAVGGAMGGVETYRGVPSAWLGPRDDGELSLLVETDDDRAVMLSFDVRQLGVALPAGAPCKVEVRVGDQSLATALIDAPGRRELTFSVAAGMNIVSLHVPLDAAERRYGDDPRPAMVYIGDLSLSEADASSQPAASAAMP